MTEPTERQGGDPTALPASVRGDGARTAALVAMIASAGGVGAGLSLGLPLLALVLESRGITGSWIGLNTAVAGFAALAITPFVTPLAARIGAMRLLIGALLTTAVALIGFYFATDFRLWFPLRLVFHGALGTAFVLSEFWIASLAPGARRGLVMGIYATVLSLGFAVGPLILRFVGSHGFLPFGLGAAIIALATIPVLFARGQRPDLHQTGRRRSVFGFVVGVPIASMAALVFGAVESGAMAILPVYGLRLGLEEGQAALIVTAAALGNVALQIPIGLVADRIDRVTVLVACALAGLAGAFVIPLVADRFPALLAVVFVWAGIIAGLYTVGLTHLGARYSGANLAAANATFVMMYAVGMMAGPPAMGLGLDAFAPHGAILVTAVFFLAYLAVVAIAGAGSRGRPRA
ncbi:MFS transporter [Prosthecomicrobium hirschii]|nr:MFS transporter [Prosthecomicrobium hirschii]